MKIGFFDSGLGGLTVLKEALDENSLCGEIYYLGDTKNTPYGTKPEDQVKKIVIENIKYLIGLGCNPIVIACNTATCLAISTLREMYKDTVFIGTEPAVKVAADAHLNKNILVLATSITVKQEKLLNLVDKLDIKEKVFLKPADKLVKFAESENCLKLDEEIDEYIKEILEEYDMEKFSHIVLGCTHFPLFKENFKRVIKKYYPNADIEIVDGAKGISKILSNNIDKNLDKISINIITTNDSEIFKKRAQEILKTREINYICKLQ